MKKSELKSLIREIITETIVPDDLLHELQEKLKTTDKTFDFALVYFSTNDNKFDYEFFDNGDWVDYETVEGIPCARVYRDKIKYI